MTKEQKRIRELLVKNNAVLLAHYYQDVRIKEIADFVGDSLELAKMASKVKADTIVFSGVYFMAETAKALNPDKRVLLPDKDASCSLSESCGLKEFEDFIGSHGDCTVVTYINSSIEIKGLSDIICTSSNAERIINSIPEGRKIIFGPDRNLGNYLSKKTGRDLICWDGTCIVHEAFQIDKLLKLYIENPESKIIAHPESEMQILEVASFIGSTSAMLEYVKSNETQSFIVVTEAGILDEMRKYAPHKKLIPAPISENNDCACSECAFMKLNTLDKIEKCLQNGNPEIFLDEDVRLSALKSLQRMMEFS